MDKYDEIAAAWFDKLPAMASSSYARRNLARLLRDTVDAEIASDRASREDRSAPVSCQAELPSYVSACVVDAGHGATQRTANDPASTDGADPKPGERPATAEAIRIAALEDTLDHICAVCERPSLMSFTIDLAYIARKASAALEGSQPWKDRPTRSR